MNFSFLKISVYKLSFVCVKLKEIYVRFVIFFSCMVMNCVLSKLS